jgi:xanthine permease XanP
VVPSIALRSMSVVLGLIAGCVLAGVLDRLALPSAAVETRVFLPDFLPYGMSIDPVIVLLLMPIFIISAAESIGDLTATNRLSGYQHGDVVYWLRIRGGLLGDSVNSGLAALVATFPNTTFSQNNGVIRATGATNPVIGIYAALILLGLGLLPLTTDWIQAIPEPVVQGMTLILFSLVVLAGWSVIHSSAPAWQDYLGIAIAASLGGWVSFAVGDWSIMPAALVSIFSFPVTNATLLMLFIEIARGKLRS